jgi:hypothetical protein
MAMTDVGIRIDLGSGVAAAQRYWLETAKPLPPKKTAPPPPEAQVKQAEPAGVA